MPNCNVRVGEFRGYLLRGLRGRSLQSGTEFRNFNAIRPSRFNLANQSSGVQIPRDICISFWLLFVLYEVQCDNRENSSNKAAMYEMQRGLAIIHAKVVTKGGFLV